MLGCKESPELLADRPMFHDTVIMGAYARIYELNIEIFSQIALTAKENKCRLC